MMLNSKPFSGTNVFMSRKLVPPELFDTLQDALKQNGAEVFLCCDPSRRGPTDYHVIASAEHEKFEDLQAKGCQMIGPQCVLSCAKERRALPVQNFTCCLAMDGVKILVSGFDTNEKEKITKLVIAMRGTIHSKASSDVNFVVAKNVLAMKYKWALNISKKPIVSMGWIDQCWKEHRVVPQEQYKIPPFSGLMICVTGIPSGERKVMEQLILQNGGKYSAELTKKCTHLISETPDGDKYKVAQRWGHICIVTRKWFDQSIARRACLNEESYPVQGATVSSINSVRPSFSSQYSQDATKKVSQSAYSAAVADSNKQDIPYSDLQDQDLEATLSQNVALNVQDCSHFLKEDNGKPSKQSSELRVDDFVADDSQSEDDDLYLSECRIHLVGFGASELRKLVSIVRKGGGSRYTSINNRLTHVVIGDLSEIEKKEIRSLTACGVINVVRASWLEDCDRLKKEIPVLLKHTGHDLLLPRGSIAGNAVIRQLNSSKTPNIPLDLMQDNLRSSSVTSVETRKRDSFETVKSVQNHFESTITVQKNSQLSSANEGKSPQKVFLHATNRSQQARSSSTVFDGKRFRFSCSFPEERRADIVQWINQGGGVLTDDKTKAAVDYTVVCHGIVPKSAIVTGTTVVSGHWIRCCLKEAQLLDVGSHILYSPLPCDVPLPEFSSFRFCASQYDVKDRLLLKNLFHTLGAKYSDKLTQKVTHLVCKFANGPKYEAACRWGIPAVTLEWIHECVQKNRAVPVDLFGPKEASTQDLEAAKYLTSQHPTQAFQMLPGENPSHCTSQHVDNSKASSSATKFASDLFREEEEHPISKRARLPEECGPTSSGSCQVPHKTSTDRAHIIENEKSKSTCNVSRGTPEIADAIEVFLEETSKICEVKSPERAKFDENFTSVCQDIDRQPQQAILGSVFGLSNQLRSSSEREDDFGHSTIGDLSAPAKHDSRSSPAKDDPLSNIPRDVNANIYDSFSETQTESQVVGYEEDLSGRQMIIDRILARSSLT